MIFLIRDILEEIKKSSFSVLPIYALVIFLVIIKLVSLTGYEILSFSIATALVIFGISLSTNGEMEYELADYSLSDNFFLSYLEYFWEKTKDVGLSIGLLLACFIVVDLIFLHSTKKQIILLLKGLMIAYIGLVFFLAAVDCTYMGVGYKIGCELSEKNRSIIIILAFVIGALTVLAEPAIKILITQVEEMTNGLIKRRSMLISLAVGVGCAIAVAMIRIVYKFSILYVIIPGYIICFVLAFFIPKIYTAIAFDAGGVASGPLTSSFILFSEVAFLRTSRAVCPSVNS